MVCTTPFGLPVDPDVYSCADQRENRSTTSAQTTYVENEERVLGADWLGRAVRWNLRSLDVPPLVATLSPWYLLAGAAEDQDVLDERALLECGVDNDLGCDRFSSTSAFVSCDDNSRAAVGNTVAQRLGAETGKYDAVDSTNSRTSEEGGRSLPGHRKIDRNDVAFLDAE